jgi:hypothetical protein
VDNYSISTAYKLGLKRQPVNLWLQEAAILDILFALMFIYCRYKSVFDEVTGGWRKLHNEERHNLYTSPNIIRIMKSKRMGWSGHIARMGKTRNAYRILVGKPEGKSPLGRPRRV